MAHLNYTGFHMGTSRIPKILFQAKCPDEIHHGSEHTKPHRRQSIHLISKWSETPERVPWRMRLHGGWQMFHFKESRGSEKSTLHCRRWWCRIQDGSRSSSGSRDATPLLSRLNLRGISVTPFRVLRLCRRAFWGYVNFRLCLVLITICLFSEIFRNDSAIFAN